mmetsp:Transcript_5266/g.14701  ORF Transcript_5266/g.14701 Transcript_5266/m.14701 type:complete len:298 (+) Transcript_5266:280-1173(+)|eukprot:CAMPEP_0117681060 /NCGR_PEP_ID=MMETSP0804-20121206/18738_1 /TAXON_ID=1074897 /ORGANISM="Tetraselmis astigmatica, Strain CCMP880" /LENGTH=297 /DNA_ID=CAMNT_0005490707 /DNA_START=228 /DNA_END=1121 /DNA_ORIENTATION=+
MSDDPSTLFAVFQALQSEDLARVTCVCKLWHATGASHGLWRQRCLDLWADKVHVSPLAKEALDTGDAYRAYSLSILDGRRCQITDKELTSIVWHRRMKKSAGESWTANDPYWQGMPSNRTQFHADGTATFLQIPGFDHPFQDPADHSPGLLWRWIKGSCGKTGHAVGSLLRLSMRDREFPTQELSRHPSNWGWIMQNCWAVSCSFPLPPPGEDPVLEDEALEVTVSSQAEEAMAFNLGLPVLPEEGSDGSYNNLVNALLASLNNDGHGTDDEPADEEGDENEDEDWARAAIEPLVEE